MFKNEGGGVKGRLNNVKKNRQFGTGEGPLCIKVHQLQFWVHNLVAEGICAALFFSVFCSVICWYLQIPCQVTRKW